MISLIDYVPKAFSGPATTHVGEASGSPWRSSTGVLSADGGLFVDPVILSIRKI